MVPGLSQVVILWNAANPANAAVWHARQAAAGAMGLPAPARQEGAGPGAWRGALAFTAQARPDALLVLDDALLGMHREQDRRLRHPAAPAERVCLKGIRAWPAQLMSYGPSLPDLFRRAATYVDKILKGAKPADLPMERPTTFELVVDLKRTGALGLAIPPTIPLPGDRGAPLSPDT